MDSLGYENREESAPKSAYNRRLLKIMLSTILALFLAVAIGIGVGVGVTRSKAQQRFPYHETILEGSSLAVLAPPNGPRRLFFQRRNGNIIQALFQASENKWNTEVVVSSSARNNTPISAIISDGSVSYATTLEMKTLAEWFRSCTFFFIMYMAMWVWPVIR